MAIITTSPDRTIGAADTNETYRVEDYQVLSCIRVLLETEEVGSLHVRFDKREVAA